jgi:hypothetical protein
MIHIGFTGTRKGMSPVQMRLLARTLDTLGSDDNRNPSSLRRLSSEITVHHGACRGSDEQFHEYALRRGYKICIHPTEERFIQARARTPDNPRGLNLMDPVSYRMSDPKNSNIIRILSPFPPMIRNDHILEHSDMLIAAPDFGTENRARSGSWATIRHAKKRQMMIRVLFPELAQNDSYGTG